MDNEPSVPSLMPVRSDTRTHNVVTGSPSIDLRDQSFVAGISHQKDCNMPGQTFGKLHIMLNMAAV